MSEFNLRNRSTDGNTAPLENWGADSDYGVLRDILLGSADHYQWLETSSVSKKSIRRGYTFNNAVARAQHAEMVDAYRSAGVNVHFLEADPALPYQVFARDSSVMTPYGVFI
ncbi:MAG: arginine deiminase-related protein, partial [Pseudomonadota bacterium]